MRPKGNDYASHHVITQWLLGILGAFDWECVEAIRGDVPAIEADASGRSRRARDGAPALSNVVVAAVYRLTVEIDGRRTVVEEIGECGDPQSWRHDGARLKDAASDAIKRCGMRVGLGLHLWAGDHYVLDQRLTASSHATDAPSD